MCVRAEALGIRSKGGAVWAKQDLYTSTVWELGGKHAGRGDLAPADSSLGRGTQQDPHLLLPGAELIVVRDAFRVSISGEAVQQMVSIEEIVKACDSAMIR